MSQATQRFKGFAIKEAWVAQFSATVAATWETVPVIAGSTLDLAIAEAPVRDGEGRLQHTWYHTQDATLTLIMREWSMRVLELVSGNPVSSASGMDKIEFGREEELTPPLLRFKLKCRAVSQDGTTSGYLYVYCYKVACSFPTIGMEETAPHEMTITGKCLHTVYDELAAALPTECFGRIEGLAAA